MPKVKCDYCLDEAKLVSGSKIYPALVHLHSKKFWLCESGHPPAYVGCHPGTTKPLGRLADKLLRTAKMNAHAHFDLIWKSKQMTRHGAYKWLADQLGLTRSECHIGMFNIEMCEKVVSVCEERIKC